MAGKRGRPLKYIPFAQFEHDGNTYQVKGLKETVRMIIDDALDEKTIECSFGETKSFDEFLNEKIKSENSVDKQAEDLAQSLIEIKQFVDHPIGYALNKAKKKLGYEYELASTVGDSDWKKQVVGKYTAMELTSNAINVALQAAEFGFSRYCTLQEDYMSQQAINNVMGSINRVKGAGSSVISGVLTGSKVAGVGGAVVGGVVGAVSYGTQQYIQYQKKMSGYYQQLNSTNFETGFAASKAGLVNNSRGTEN